MSNNNPKIEDKRIKYRDMNLAGKILTITGTNYEYSSYYEGYETYLMEDSPGVKNITCKQKGNQQTIGIFKTVTNGIFEIEFCPVDID